MVSGADGGSSGAGMGSPTAMPQGKEGKKGRNWRKMQISFRFGSKHGVCLLPAPSVPAGLCPPLSSPFTAEEQAGSPLRTTFPWENGKTRRCGDGNANQWERGEERNSVWPLQIAGKVTQLFRAARGGRER